MTQGLLKLSIPQHLRPCWACHIHGLVLNHGPPNLSQNPQACQLPQLADLVRGLQGRHADFQAQRQLQLQQEQEEMRRAAEFKVRGGLCSHLVAMVP